MKILRNDEHECANFEGRVCFSYIRPVKINWRQLLLLFSFVSWTHSYKHTQCCIYEGRFLSLRVQRYLTSSGVSRTMGNLAVRREKGGFASNDLLCLPYALHVKGLVVDAAHVGASVKEGRHSNSHVKIG